MTKTEFLIEFEKFKKLFIDIYAPSFLNSDIREILEKDFTLLATKRTRKESTKSFGNNLDELLEHRKVAQGDYYRIFTITHFDIEIEVITNNNISSIFDLKFKNVPFSNIEKFVEVFQEDWENEMYFLFLNGKLYSNDEVFKTADYLGITKERSKILGEWECEEFKISFDYNKRFFQTIGEKELNGEYFFMNNKIRLKFKNAEKYNLQEEKYYDFNFDEEQNLILSNFNYGHYFYLEKQKLNPDPIMEREKPGR